jgi:hypothetical protein
LGVAINPCRQKDVSSKTIPGHQKGLGGAGVPPVQAHPRSASLKRGEFHHFFTENQRPKTIFIKLTAGFSGPGPGGPDKF